MRTHIESGLVWTDSHGQYTDTKVIKLIASIVTDLKPHYLIDLGDLCDYPSYSTHSKRQRESIKETVNADHVAANMIYDTIHGASPKSRKKRVKGNHDDRQRQYFMEYPELFEENVLQDNALHIKKRGFKDEDSREYGEWLKIGKLYFLHGWRTGQNAVRAHLINDYHANFVMGHIHKSDTATTTNIERKAMQGYAVGCSSLLDFKYSKNKNSNHGFAIFYVLPNGNYTLTNYTINDYRVVVEGQLYDFSKKVA